MARAIPVAFCLLISIATTARVSEKRVASIIQEMKEVSSTRHVEEDTKSEAIAADGVALEGRNTTAEGTGTTNKKWWSSAQHICCCTCDSPGCDKTPSTALTCTWKQPWTLDTGSGCNFVGSWNYWADQRRVSGIINEAGNQFKVFDTSQYATKEEEYKDLCSGISGEFVGKDYNTGSGEVKHHWFLKNEEEGKNIFMPDQIRGTVEEFTKIVKDAAQKVETTDTAPKLEAVEVAKIDDDARVTIEEEAAKAPKEIKKKMVKRAAPGELCPFLCEPWPAPLGRLTPKNGCQVIDKYRCKFANRKKCKGLVKAAEKYCKNKCEGLFRNGRYTHGDCTGAPQ